MALQHQLPATGPTTQIRKTMTDRHEADAMWVRHLRKQLLVKGLRFEQFEQYHDDSVGLLLTPDQAMRLAEYRRTCGFTNEES